MRKKRSISYINGDSFVHNLDPRTKLFILVLISLTAFISSELTVAILLFILVSVMAFFSGLFAEWLKSLRLIVPLLMFIVLIELFFCPESSGEIFFSGQAGILNPVLSEGSIGYSAFLGFRLLSIAGISFLFILTTGYSDFIKSLQLMKIPSIITFSMGYALRATTVLSGDANAVMDAQRSRGLEFDRNSFFRNRNKLIALFIPLTVTVLNRSSQVSDAMQCRGYGSEEKETIYNPPSFKRNDLVICLFFCFFLIFLLFFSGLLKVNA